MDEAELARQVGNAIAVSRQSAGLSQEQVADRVGVSQETISRFERGAGLPSLVRLAAIADVLSIPITLLLQQTSVRTVDQADEILRAMEPLSEGDRVWVKNMLTELCVRLAAAHK